MGFRHCAGVIEASYEYIEALTAILVTLAQFYSPGTFGEDPHRFFSELVEVTRTFCARA